MGRSQFVYCFLHLSPVGLGCRRKEGGSLFRSEEALTSLYSFECRSLDNQSASVFLTQPQFTALCLQTPLAPSPGSS